MDSTRILTSTVQTNVNFNQPRYLPTYEESNAPYSLRLPSYRSSYIRRFHPYARFTTLLIEERYMDDCDHGDEGPLLNLSILDEPIRTVSQTAAEPVAAFVDGRFAQQNQESRVEEQCNGRREMPLVIVNPDMITVHPAEEEVEQGNPGHPRQPSPFLRMDVTEPHFKDL
ncbi:hypothetical protein AX14_014170 [Amanita brunnescens Koide BX004]|nr:hypothetical protein AX14_014170 [Amanita brunnescens Koide BX004]